MDYFEVNISISKDIPLKILIPYTNSRQRLDNIPHSEHLCCMYIECIVKQGLYINRIC